MNKQTNIYRNYIFYHLADGRILASMPTVGDMIFENETEFKAYIDGYLITKEHFKLIENELRHAVAKHPKFCEGFTDDLTGADPAVDLACLEDLADLTMQDFQHMHGASAAERGDALADLRALKQDAVHFLGFCTPYYTTSAPAGQPRTSASPSAVTLIVAPGRYLPATICFAIGFSRSRWIARFTGRAP